jgi:uracil-DNA glycosylase family 4
MAFRGLFDVPTEAISPVQKASSAPNPHPTPKKRATASLKPAKGKPKEALGCHSCTLDKIPGVQKIMGEIHGRSMAIFAQSPGPEENSDGEELVGPSGKWWWKELKRVGLKRSDFDIQNVVRCFPCDFTEGTYNNYLKMRGPSQHEIKCCSVHTDAAVQQLKAKQILVLGQIAAKALLKTRSLPQAKTFWSDELNARIYLLDHPSFFIRGYGQGTRLQAFRKMLERIVQDRASLDRRENTVSDQFAYLRAQKYKLVVNTRQALKAARFIRRAAGRGRFVAVDIEADTFDGKYQTFACGFCYKPGLTYVFVFSHKDQSRANGKNVLAIAKELLEDAAIAKTFQYGCSDVEGLAADGVTVQGYRHDTNLSEYLRFSDVKAYGLDAIAERRFPEFSGYKLVRTRPMVEAAARKYLEENPGKDLPKILRSDSSLEAQDKWLETNRELHLRHLSLNDLRLYNGADCDLTKRIELSNRKKLPEALVRLYIDLNFLLRKMEVEGPLFDYEHSAKLELLYPAWEQKLRLRLQELIGDDDYNPGSHDQVYKAIYETLGLEFPFEGKPNTRKGALTMLSQEHEFPQLQIEWRQISKAKGTYAEGYKKCADGNNGRLRTRWWSTGTRTGRLSSGGSRNKNVKVINLQNIKKAAIIQNLCVADVRWRRVFDAFQKIMRKHGGPVQKYWDECTAIDKKNKARRAKKRPLLKYPAEPSKLLVKLASLFQSWVETHVPDLKTYLMLDYGQMEVRTAAQISNDENLIKDCAESDIHSTVGSAVTGWDVERIKNDEATRTLTKNCVFGILFGISKKNLFKFVVAMSPPDMRGRVTEEQVEDAYDRFFARYDKIRQMIVDQRAFGQEHKYVTTLFGMYQTLNVTEGNEEDDVGEMLDLDEIGAGRGAYWGNQAVNGPVQGTAHQVLVCGLVNLLRKKLKYALLGIPPMEVHDALYFVVPVLQLAQAYKLGKELLEKESLATIASDFPSIKWRVPIVVDVKAGIRLGTKIKVGAKTTAGEYLLNWFRICKQQEDEIDGQLEEIAA